MIIKGQPLADQIILKLKGTQTPRKKLVVISISDDKASSIYIGKKAQIAQELGILFDILKLDESITKDALLVKIDELNTAEDVGGIIIQMPIPSHLDRAEICSKIIPQKDIDGFSYILSKSGKTLPPTVMAIDALLDFYALGKEGKKILIIGKGFLVGSPLYNFYKSMGLDVDALDEGDSGYAEKIKAAAVVILATGGKAKFGKSNFAPGAAVIDASTVASDNKLTGDLEYDSIGDQIDYSPVPGGVGPVTVAMLFVNFYLLCGSNVEGFGLINSN